MTELEEEGKTEKMSKVETRDLEFVEKKHCLTFSKICVNLGKVADLETGIEEYYCTRDFPDDCSQYGCPHYMSMTNPKEWRLRRLSKREIKILREFKEKEARS